MNRQIENRDLWIFGADSLKEVTNNRGNFKMLGQAMMDLAGVSSRREGETSA